MKISPGTDRDKSMMEFGLFVRRLAAVAACMVAFAGSQLFATLQTDDGAAPNTSEADSGDSITLDMGQAGIGRFRPNHWGMIKGRVTNKSDQTISCLTVVTPEGSSGLQFARKMTIPSRVAFQSNWPVYVHEAKASGGIEFQYLFFPDGKEDGVIRRVEGSGETPSFSGITQFDLLPLSGLLGDSGLDRRDDSATYILMGVMRYGAFSNKSVTALSSTEITANSECLDALSQIAVTDPNLTASPEACEALRSWVLRGGRLFIAAESTGPAVVEALLGDSLPMTVAGETTTNTLTLEINPEYPQSQYPARTIAREYPEPVRYLRVVPGHCEKIWTVDGWPVAMAKSLGRGSVLVTTISSEVFYDPTQHRGDEVPQHSLIASCRRMQDVLFNGRPGSLIAESTAADQAAALVGYRIPSRRVAFMLLTLFPLGILIAGLFLQKRASGERLIVAVPAVSMMAALPALIIGLQIRSVAPATVIESLVVSSSPGFTDLPTDGFASLYAPSPRDLGVSAEPGTRLDSLRDNTNSDYRRMTWHAPGVISWENFQQPAGLRTYSVNSVRHVKKPLSVRATLNESGLTGTLPTDDGLTPEDPILAGMNRENLALDQNGSGQFEGSLGQSLPTGQYFRSTLLSDDERYRTALLNSVFYPEQEAQDGVFPPEPAVLFWDKSDSEVLHFEGNDVRRQRAVLVIHPLELYPPEAGQPFLIPPQLMTYRSVVNDDGGYGSSYVNLRRTWQSQESASKTMLEFQIPDACRPFTPESGELNLLIRAGSRLVSIKSGERDKMQTIADLKSPLGMQTVSIPGELIHTTCQEGHLYLQIQVSDLESQMNEDDMTGEQDDSWQIERVLLSLKGQRKL